MLLNIRSTKIYFMPMRSTNCTVFSEMAKAENEWWLEFLWSRHAPPCHRQRDFGKVYIKNNWLILLQVTFFFLWYRTGIEERSSPKFIVITTKDECDLPVMQASKWDNKEIYSARVQPTMMFNGRTDDHLNKNGWGKLNVCTEYRARCELYFYESYFLQIFQ